MNCRPLNGFFLDFITLSPKPPKSAAFYPISGPSKTLQQNRAFCRAFFAWYNTEHRHSGLALMTPHQVHYGDTRAIRTARQAVLDEGHRRHPERFVRKPPEAPTPPAAVWINPPADRTVS